MNNRRRFIALVPFAGAALLAACSKETPSSSATPAPAPAPSPAPPAAQAPATPPAPSSASTDSAAAGATRPLLQESDPVAAGLGYVSVASRADSAKYKTYAPGQACGNCSLFGGRAGDSRGPCQLFAGKDVMASGWCSAYVKKAG